MFDIPVEREEDREKLRQIARDNSTVLIDYWAIDWDYDGTTYRSQWQGMRGHGRRSTTVANEAAKEYSAGKKHQVAVRVVDVFGNDVVEIVEVDLR